MLPFSQLSSSSLPILRDVDLLVVGGGTAGAIAGIAGGRAGLKTLVVEQFGFLGGSQSGALVTPMMPNQIEGEPLNGGIDMELNRRMNAMCESGVWKDGNRGWFNPEMLKHVLEQMSGEAGTELLYFTFVDDVIMEENAVRGVTVVNKAGRSAILAKRIIDASGDADIAFRAGAPVEVGDPETGINQPFSVRFHLGNIDLNRFAEYLKSLGRHDVMEAAEGSDVPLIHTAMVWGKGWTLEPLFRKAVDEGVLLESDGHYFQVFSMAGRPGEMAFNCPRIRESVDGTNPFHLTRAMVTGRELINRYVAFCRTYLPGFERSYLVFSAPMVGVRESRRIRGEYYLTTEDYFAARKFDDAILRNCYPLDIHRDKDHALNMQRLKPGEYHEVPYRCLIPLRVENLLVAGRCFSGSFEAQSSVRIQSNCRAMGEAAAVASAMSLQRNVPPRQMDGKDLRARLKELGGRL